MKLDSICWQLNKRICVSIDDDLFEAYCKFSKKRDDIVQSFLKKKIKLGEIKNSAEAKLFIFSQMMKPSAYKCFVGALPDQVDVEDM